MVVLFSFHLKVVDSKSREDFGRLSLRRTSTIDGDRVRITVRTNRTFCPCLFVVASRWGRRDGSRSYFIGIGTIDEDEVGIVVLIYQTLRPFLFVGVLCKKIREESKPSLPRIVTVGGDGVDIFC